MLGLLLASLYTSGTVWAIAHKEGPTPDEQRADIRKLRDDTLAQLYKEQPAAKGQIADSKGYAVFSNTGINVLMLSTGRGSGVVRDKRSGKDIYMNMFSAGGGFGMGVKTFRAVFIFHTADALDAFVEKGWDFSGQADAAATTDADAEKEVGAVDMAATLTQGVTVYQLTDKGLALQATLQGTKYWKDDELN
jgi:lipid-binding SYLF domain-containing protein